MKRSSIYLLPMFLFSLVGGNVLGQGAVSPANGRTFVVTAGGAGGYSTLTDNLDTIYECGILKCRRPIVSRVPWASDGENLSDYRDRQRHLRGAARMAYEVQRIRKCAPDSPIVLIGYSAGASIVLVAAEILPAGSLERVILLGPSVSANYDPRRAILACNHGIDSFNVLGDPFMEDLEDTFGAPYEGPGTRIASNVGFRLAHPCSVLAKDPLMCKLRQHNVGWLQNGHFGTVSPSFLTQFVVPLIPFGEIRPVPPR